MGNIGITKNDYEYWFNKPSSFKALSTSGTSIKATDGILTGVMVGSGAAPLSIAIYDTSTTGTTLPIITSMSTSAGLTRFPNIKFDNGLYVVVTGATGAISIYYK